MSTAPTSSSTSSYFPFSYFNQSTKPSASPAQQAEAASSSAATASDSVDLQGKGGAEQGVADKATDQVDNAPQGFYKKRIKPIINKIKSGIENVQSFFKLLTLNSKESLEKAFLGQQTKASILSARLIQIDELLKDATTATDQKILNKESKNIQTKLSKLNQFHTKTLEKYTSRFGEEAATQLKNGVQKTAGQETKNIVQTAAEKDLREAFEKYPTQFGEKLQELNIKFQEVSAKLSDDLVAAARTLLKKAV